MPMDDPTANDNLVESDTSGEPPPMKRKRIHSKKAIAACEACQKRKSRCEVFSATTPVCHRCQVLGTECSLQLKDLAVDEAHDHAKRTDSDAVRLPDPTPGSGDFKDIVSRIDQRTAEVERIMRRLLATSNNTVATSIPFSSCDTFGDREDGVGDGDDMEQTVWELLQHSVGTSLQAMSGLNLHDRTRFQDPITSGLLSEPGFNDVCVQFTTLVRRTCPVDELLPDTPLLSHPFLRCAILHFMSFTRSSSVEDVEAQTRLEQILHANIALLPSANPSPATLIGLLILALCPASGFETRFLRTYAPYGAMAHAASIGHGLGLQDAADRARQESEKDLVEAACFRPMVLQLALFYTLAHQTAWSDMYSSPSFSCGHSIATPFSSILSLGQIRKLRSPLLVHLYYESQLLSHAALVSTAFQRLRTSIMFDVSRLMVLWHQMDKFQASASQWRSEVAEEEFLESKHFLVLNSLFLEFFMCLKLSTDAGTLLPSPLVLHDREPFRMAFAGQMMSMSEALVNHIITSKLDLSLVPSFYLTLSFLPCKALPNAAMIDPSRQAFVDSPTFRRFRGILLGAHPLSAAMVERIDQSRPPSGWRMLFEDQDPQAAPIGVNNSQAQQSSPPKHLPVEPLMDLAHLPPVAADEDLQQWWAFEDVTNAFTQFDDAASGESATHE